MNDFTKDILIYRAENLHFDIVDNRIEGDLNKVIWGDIDKIADGLTNILNATGVTTEAIPFFSIKEKIIGKRIKILKNSENIDAEYLAQTFHTKIIKITKRDTLSGELFNQQLSPHDEIIKKEVNNFLAQNSNKHVRQALKMNTGNNVLDLSGQFAEFESQQNIDGPVEIHSAVVDGLVNNTRIVTLKLLSGKLIEVFFSQNDFWPLHPLMLKVPHQFKLQKKYDARGKLDMYLISIEGSSLTSEFNLI